MNNAVRQRNSAAIPETTSFTVKTPVAEQKAIRLDPPPEHPFLARFGSNVHNDGYMSDTYNISGPVGGELRITQARVGGFPISLTFDSKGRIITVVMNFETGDRNLLVVDQESLGVLATETVTEGQKDSGMPDPDAMGGGVYFVLDSEYNAIVPTLEGKIQFYKIGQGDVPTITKGETYDLSSIVVTPDQIISALPDWNGNLWYVTQGGLVGFVNKDQPKPTSDTYVQLVDDVKEEIANSFAVDNDGGVFVVSDHALYRFGVEGGKLKKFWRGIYDRGSEQKPGQKSQGSGTTPTLIDMKDEKFVAIADNGDQMCLRVFRRESSSDQGEEVWTAPVFKHGNSATENSLIGIGKFLIVENNYDYGDPTATMGMQTTSRGLEMIALGPGKETPKMWGIPLDVPSVVSKLSLSNGLVYTYIKKKIGWHLAAVYFETGKLAFEAFTGLTSLVNCHYAGLCLGPDGTAYIGVIEGIVAVKQIS